MSELRLAHVSDLHLACPWPLAPWRYLGKRAIGAFNFQVRRKHEYPPEAARALVRELAGDTSIDHVAITGDVTNVSFPEEFAAAREVLRPLLERAPGFVSMIPGNHDRYTFTSQRRRYFERTFGELTTSELDLGAPFPFVRFRGGVALLGLDSGVATLPFFATGTLGEPQRARLARALDDPRVRGASFRVGLVHHAPFAPGGSRDRPLHRLTDDRELLEVATRGGIDLLLHGHIHTPFEVAPAPGRAVRTIGSGSSTRLHESPRKVGGLNVYTIRDGALASVETRTYDPRTGSYSGRRPGSAADLDSAVGAREG